MTPSIASARPHSWCDAVMGQPNCLSGSTALPITTGRPANSSISRSFRLSPIAMTAVRSSPRAFVQARSAAPFGPAAGDQVEQREVALRVLRQGDGYLRRLRQGTHLGGQRPHLIHAAGERHLGRVLGERRLDRLDAGDERAVPFVVPVPLGMAPVDALVDVLPGVGPVEDDRDPAMARAHRLDDGARRVARHEAAGPRSCRPPAWSTRRC